MSSGIYRKFGSSGLTNSVHHCVNPPYSSIELEYKQLITYMLNLGDYKVDKTELMSGGVIQQAEMKNRQVVCGLANYVYRLRQRHIQARSLEHKLDFLIVSPIYQFVANLKWIIPELHMWARRVGCFKFCWYIVKAYCNLHGVNCFSWNAYQRCANPTIELLHSNLPYPPINIPFSNLHQFILASIKLNKSQDWLYEL